MNAVKRFRSTFRRTPPDYPIVQAPQVREHQCHRHRNRYSL